MALLRASVTVGGYTMASRILGFARDILVANFLGAGPVVDAFVVAFRIPNLFRRLGRRGRVHRASCLYLFASSKTTAKRRRCASAIRRWR